ncbi:MAG: cytochrome B6, partial [Desulfuromonadales bacterium]|nr:cytochrome B6 [Desulfuromonadales bacterium]NIS42437.1 cytochrome B6 [Desulfuromonadales bacterium]
MKRNFLHHLHPAQVNRRTLHPATTLGLGIACLTCLFVLLLTGVTLFLYYVPEPSRAYERILHITTTLHFG